MGERHEKLSRIDPIVNRCMWDIAIVCGICLVVTAVICTCDALLSKFFSVSIPNGIEWVTYLNIPVVFFALAYIQVDRGHTTVDLLCAKFPQKVQKVIKVVGDVLGMVVCLFSGYCAMRLTADKFSTMTKSSSASNAFVIWPFVLVIAIGFVAVGVAFAWCIVRDILKNGAENTEEKEEVMP